MNPTSATSALKKTPSQTAADKRVVQENQLIKKITKDRDHQAMETLYHLYRQPLGSFLYRMSKNKSLTDEIYNEVMVIVWQKAKQFNGQSKLSTWIYAIAYRQCLQSIRKEDKHKTDEFDESLSEASSALNTDENHTEQNQLITIALKKLSFDHQQVIELSYFTGYSYKEIGLIVNKSENTIKTRMFHAKKKLKDAITRLRLGVNS